MAADPVKLDLRIRGERAIVVKSLRDLAAALESEGNGSQPCPNCGGLGWYEGAFGAFDCQRCGGKGVVAGPRAASPGAGAPTTSSNDKE